MLLKIISKTFSIKKAGIILISILVFGGLFLHAQPARAIFGVGDIGLLDAAMMQLDALDFVDNIVLRFIVFLFVLIAESQAFIAIAAALLQWAVNLPINLHNNLVLSGWNFVSGLTNLFFVLIFVGIALAFILKTETFGMKKALPNLIIIALLINFSLVFVGIMVDIGDIFRNSLLTSFGDDFVSLAIEPLKTSSWSVAAWFLAIPVGYLITALIPYANVAGLVIVGGLFLTDVATGGIMLRGLMLMALNFVTGAIFFLYFGLFLVRIVIIWLLAVAAPLALFAYILPATKKYFSQWLHMLLSWTLMGIVAVFLIGLGLKLFAATGGDALLAWGSDIDAGGRGILPSFLFNYLFLIIYMGVTFFVCKKYVPTGADIIMNQGSALIGKAWGGLKTTRTMGQAAEETAGTLGAVAAWGRRLDEKSKGKPWSAFAKPLAWSARGAGFAVAPLIDYAAGVRKIPLPKNWKQMTIDDKVASINASRRDEDKLVKMHAMGEEDTIQKAPQLWDLHDRLQKKFENDPHFLRERGDLADILTHRIDADIKVNLEVTDSDRGQMEQDINNKAKELSQEIEMKPVIDEEAARVLREGLAKTQAEAQSLASRNVAARYIHYTELKSGDMKSQAKKSIESAVAGRALRDMTPQHLQAIQNNFKTETINKVMENTFQKMFEGRSDAEARKILDDYYASDPKHARMVHWAATTPAGRELNLPLRRYMTNPNDQATTSIDAYERKQRVREILSRLSPTEKPLERFYNLHIDANKFQNQIEDAEKRIEGLRLRGQSTTIWETKLNSTQQRLDSVLQDIATTHDLEIEPNPNLRRKWEEIETLRRGKPIKEKPPRQPRGPQRGGGGSTTGGGGPTPRGGGPTPRGPAQTPPPPSPSRQPKPPSTPQQPSQQRPPSRSTPTTPAPAPPETPSKGPAWFAAGIESIRGGKIPTIIPKKLENLLHSNGFRRSEINKMKPAEAWAKAEEIIKKEKK